MWVNIQVAFCRPGGVIVYSGYLGYTWWVSKKDNGTRELRILSRKDKVEHAGDGYKSEGQNRNGVW